ncbi:MAG: hypothetical protein LBT65_00995 [Synergistaceae bacterium]|jgi:medium-chain acyl-[acyl-carrier-protein] hydrolase|nr:hypothetical protein [Synergistaceae bacterium]
MYARKLNVMPSSVGCAGEIKLRRLLDFLQDTAALAVENREGTPGELMGRGYAWVLLRYELEVTGRLPGMDESITIETRHTPNDGLHTLRVFRVFNEANRAETLVMAKTSWVLIDLAAGRPVRAGQHLPEIFTDVADDPPIDPDFTPIPKLSKSDETGFSTTLFPVRFHDLDANGHVNNAVYFEWAFEATPLDLPAWSVREMRSEFRVSAKLGDAIAVRVGEMPPDTDVPEGARAFVYEMLDARGGENGEKSRPLARFAAVWTPLVTPGALREASLRETNS